MKKRVAAFFLLLFAVLAGLCIFIWIQVQGFVGGTGEEHASYAHHYALITEGSNEEFWQQAYTSGLDAARRQGAYLEDFGSSLAGTYTRNDLLKMAQQASVDGIIVEASEDQDTIDLIDDIVGSGIPVVTVMGDCPGSVRQSYVGVNNYDIGLLYGEKAAQMILAGEKKEVHVLVAVKGEGIDTSQNLVLLGVREKLQAENMKSYEIYVEARAISQTGSFAVEEYFNQLFLEEEQLPDILICLDALSTGCAAQAAVDHNRVGDVEIIGYYASKENLQAVERQVLEAVLSLDANQLGRCSVDALEDYLNTGYTNSYQAIAVEMIGQEAAAARLKEEEEQEP